MSSTVHEATRHSVRAQVHVFLTPIPDGAEGQLDIFQALAEKKSHSYPAGKRALWASHMKKNKKYVTIITYVVSTPGVVT